MSSEKQTFDQSTEEALALVQGDNDSQLAPVYQFPDRMSTVASEAKRKELEDDTDAGERIIRNYGNQSLTPEKRPLFRRAAGLLATVAITAGAVAGINNANQTDFEGQRTITLDGQDPEGNRNSLTDVAVNNVEGAVDDVPATVNKIVEMNPGVFEDGRPYIGPEDIGAEVTIPESVDK